MRRTADADNSELRRVLTELLEEDVTISAREVVRRHSTLANASAISRNSGRQELLAEFEAKQRGRRSEAEGRAEPEGNKGSFAEGPLRQRLDAALSEVERQQRVIRALVTSHSACVRAVYMSGGSASLLEFFKVYKEIEELLISEGALPESGNVINISGGK